MLLLLLALAGFAGSWLHSVVAGRNAGTTPAGTELVRELDLTGLALFTEARYTRHPELSDPREALRNHPMALEHFPSGTWVRPSRRHD